MSKFKKYVYVFSLFFLSLWTANLIYSQTHGPNYIAPTGILSDAGGHKLHLDPQGKGSPTVIFENGTGDFSFIWTLVQPEITKFTGTISYDRAGYAWSDPGPMPRTGRQMCFELHTALANAGIHPPYILVGQSFGGFVVRQFAKYYPKEVVGMILVEAVQEDQRIFMGGDEPKKIRDFAQGRVAPPPQDSFTSPDTVGEAQTLNTEIDPLFNKLPTGIRKMQIWAQSQPSLMKAVSSEMDWSPEDVADLYNHRGQPGYTFGDMPLIVLTRGKGGYDGRKDSLQLENERLNAQKDLTRLSTNSKQIVDMNSGHNIHVEDPAVVISAIKDVFVAATKHSHLK